MLWGLIMKRYTDTELLDYLQDKLDKGIYTGKVICRWSSSGRGWRLHETTQDGFSDVRCAIKDFIERNNENTYQL